MVGLSEPFKLLARREGPTESGYSYAMENDKGKLDWTEGKERKEESIIKRTENSMLGKTCHFEIRWEHFVWKWCHQMSIPEGLLLNCWHWPISLFYLNHIWEETQRRSSGPGLWCIVLLWEKAVWRLEREVMSSTPRDAVLCSAAMVTMKDG